MRQPGYPVVLDTIVNRLITDWEIFKENQPLLHSIHTAEDPKALADIVRESYIRRKQAFKELEHYQQKKTLLGKHPVFEMLKLMDEISALSTPKLSNKVNSLRANLTRNRQKNNNKLVTRDEQLLEHALSVLNNR
ncbi:hypothetical protein [Winogradskyella sp.]|uniref:hypothetical protein n=1 Tax=Winogradskyella sp. TaxID=1883156 RepID=UPI003BAB83F6